MLLTAKESSVALNTNSEALFLYIHKCCWVTVSDGCVYAQNVSIGTF